jgi:NAD(P)H-dependent FMN reductase
LQNYLESIAEYDNIFVCGPCWWGTFPCAVFTQLERLDFTGKKVMALMTHEGSGLGSCERDLRKICKGASFGNGMAVHGADAAKAENAVSVWAKKNV